MTSTVSFRKELRDNMRGRIWLSAIILAVGILILPVVVYLGIHPVLTEIQDGILSPDSAVGIIFKVFASTVGMKSGYMGVAVSVAAGMSAVSGFSWLSSQERNDFMHSLPVSRGRIFAVVYMSGVILCVVPYLICQAVAVFLVPMMTGCFQSAIAAEGIKAAAFFILAFLAVYSVFCLGMILSGRTGIGAMLGVFILAVGPAVYLLATTLIRDNFTTVLIADNAVEWLISPVGIAISGTKMEISSWTAVAGLAVWTAASLVLACRVYVIRPSEKAGFAFIFRWLPPVLQIILMAFGGFLLGIMLGYYNAGSPDYVLFITGAAVGCLVVWIISELVFFGKIRNFRKKCRLIAGTFGGTLLIFFMFALDPLHVDLRIPDASEVQAMGIWSNSLDYLYMSTSYTSTVYGVEDYYEEFDDRIRDCLISDYKPMYTLAEEAASTQDALKENNDTDSTKVSVVIDVGWKLKSGRMVYREYTVSSDSLEKMWDAYRDSGEFDGKYNPFRRISISDIHSISVYSIVYDDNNTVSLNLNDEEKQELVDDLAEDFRNSRPGELLQSNYQIAMDINEWSENSNVPQINITVYDSYTDTRRFLASHGGAELLRNSASENTETVNAETDLYS